MEALPAHRSAPLTRVASQDPRLLEDPRLLAVSTQLGTTPAALALAWAVHRGVTVIPKSAHPERVRRRTTNRRANRRANRRGECDGGSCRAEH